MVIAVVASVLAGGAGYVWLAQNLAENALRAHIPWWAVLAGALSGLIAATLWRPGVFGAVVVIGLCPLFIALAVVDVAEHRLPNRMTGALALMTALGLGMTGLAESHELSLRRAALGAVVLGLGYLMLAFMGGGSGMGLGDVKLAPSLGALTAWFGWNTWASGTALAFVLGGVWGVVLLARGRGLKAQMPFGPFMMVGAVIALIAA